MKIFHLGLCVGEPPFDSMRKGFLANCTGYRELSTGVLNVNQRAINIVREFKPDIVFMQIQSPNIISMQTVQEFKKCRAWVCNWNGDIRANTPDWMVQMSQVVDKTLFSNMRDVGNVQNGAYLEIGFDPEIYHPQGERLPCRPIAFFGNNYGASMFPLSGFRLEMDQALRKAFPNEYGVYGNQWGQSLGNFNHSQAEEAARYRSVKIGINLSHFDEDSYTSDRIYRIMGSGAMCLAKRWRNMPFQDGVHLRVWDTIPELVKLIKQGHDAEIAKRGCDFVHANYTFDNMVKNLIKIYNS